MTVLRWEAETPNYGRDYSTMTNTIVAAAVGALASLAITIGGVNAIKGDPQPVSENKLTTYSSQ